MNHSDQAAIGHLPSDAARLPRRLAAGLVFCLAVLAARAAGAQIDFEREPIDYLKAPRRDPAAQLQQKLDQGAARLEYDARHGYLPSLLRALDIPQESQTLVFSKTSFQRNRISPKKPRAIYYNDSAYVGSVQDGEVIEISAADPRLGAVFYTLEQKPADRPRLLRQTDDCLQCHASSMTQGVPGHLVRSVFPGGSGMPVLSAGSFRTTWQSPLRERWGGWYVTGTHGAQRHMGNALLRGTEDPEKLDRESGANLTDLRGRIDVAPYLTPHSDIVALMVLEHQVPAHNQLTLAHYQTLLALREQAALNQMDARPPDAPIPGIQRRIEAAGDDVLRCLLFCGEAPLSGEVRGTSGFARRFASLGPRDKQGRSLRDFDLHKRLFKHPCSYLIYSEAFAALPGPLRTHVGRRLGRILSGQDPAAEFAHLTPEDRRAVAEIVRGTKPDLAASWGEGKR